MRHVTVYSAGLNPHSLSPELRTYRESRQVADDLASAPQTVPQRPVVTVTPPIPHRPGTRILAAGRIGPVLRTGPHTGRRRMNVTIGRPDLPPHDQPILPRGMSWRYNNT